MHRFPAHHRQHRPLGLVLVLGMACQATDPAPPQGLTPSLRRHVARDLDPLFKALLDDTLPVGDRAPDPTRGIAYDTSTGVQLVDDLLLAFLLDAARGAVERTWERDQTAWARAAWPADVSGQFRRRPDGNLRVLLGGAVTLPFESEVPEGAELVLTSRAVLAPVLPQVGDHSPEPLQLTVRDRSGVLTTLYLSPDGALAEARVGLHQGATLSVECGPGGPDRGDPPECELVRAELLADPGQLPAKPPVLRSCDPAGPGCAETLVTAFMRRAWGREPSEDERARYLAVARSGADREHAARTALTAIVVSPHTLFQNAAAVEPSGRALAFATVLSQLLTRSPPDDALLDAARTGALSTVDGVRAEVRRLMAKPEFERFLSGFVTSWLILGSVSTAPRDAPFPMPLRDDMAHEATLNFAAAVREGTPLPQLVKDDRTYVDDALASHYGILGPSADGFTLRSLAGTERAGLVTLGAALAANAFTATSSWTLRGRWLLDRFVCAAPPPPPPEIPTQDSNPSDSFAQAVARHRTNPVCAGCHVVMDPVGLSFEMFGTVGQRRTPYVGLDEPATWADGSRFSTAAELASSVAADPRLGPCFVRHLFTYAVGREPDLTDEAALGDLSAAFAAGGLRLAPLIEDVVVSEPFRRTAELDRGSVP